ncbi:MAG: hypothetical protein K0Q79_2331 [Flavipsychrobacter sp.]|nr:hypothetical protein [Flavipsychrobacter sp.]
MKKLAFLFVTMLMVSIHSQAIEKTLKQVMILKIDRTGGANGANIVWHPVQKKYYAAQAGNVAFPMLVFDAKGKKLSPEDLETKFDVRGFWYNPNTKTLQANGYDDFGLSEYRIGTDGIPVSNKKLEINMSKPDAQSVGAYDPKKNVLYFYDMSGVFIEPHSMTDGTTGDVITLHLGAQSKNDGSNEDVKYDYNENAIVFTGIPKAEIGLLNVSKKQIELYDLATGLMTQKLKLPDEAPTQSSMNFSYANGIYWLFDKTERTWYGYNASSSTAK